MPRAVKIVIEPINHRDMPGFHLNTMAQGAALVEAIGFDRLGLQFDVYHCQVTEGDVTKRMEALLPVIAHMQIADVPARNEPGTGEIGWRYVFERMDALGYRAGSAANTGRPATPWPGSPGCKPLELRHEDRFHRPGHHGPPHGAASQGRRPRRWRCPTAAR